MNRPNRRNVITCTCLLVCLTTTALAFYADIGQIIHRKNSLYNSIAVYESGSVRTLQFGRRVGLVVESQVNVDDMHEHMLEYTKMTFSGLLYNAEPNSLLVLGLGGGVIPREMRHYYPDMKIDVAEIDQDILPIAAKYFGFEPDDKLKVHVGDGRVFVKRCLQREPVPQYDMIVLDAFNGDYIPFHLMTKEFLQELKGILSDDGVVVANVFYTNRLFDAEFKTFLEVFGRCQAYFGQSSGNAMLVSPAEKCQELTTQQAVQKAAEIQADRSLSFDLGWVARRLDPDQKPGLDARTLTDDVAPVNWLRNQQNAR